MLSVLYRGHLIPEPHRIKPFPGPYPIRCLSTYAQTFRRHNCQSRQPLAVSRHGLLHSLRHCLYPQRSSDWGRPLVLVCNSSTKGPSALCGDASSPATILHSHYRLAAAASRTQLAGIEGACSWTVACVLHNTTAPHAFFFMVRRT